MINNFNNNIIQHVAGHNNKNSSSSAMSIQSNGVVFLSEEAHSSVINFKSSADYGSLLSFEQISQSQQRAYHKDEYSNWDENVNHSVFHPYRNSNHSPRMSSADFNCFQTASDSSNSKLESRHHSDESSYAWLYSESTVCADSFEESAAIPEPAGAHKRHQMVIFLHQVLPVLGFLVVFLLNSTNTRWILLVIIGGV